MNRYTQWGEYIGMSRKDESWQIIGAFAVAAAHIGYRTDLME
jgi:hypothetical protein